MRPLLQGSPLCKQDSPGSSAGLSTLPCQPRGSWGQYLGLQLLSLSVPGKGVRAGSRCPAHSATLHPGPDPLQSLPCRLSVDGSVAPALRAALGVWVSAAAAAAAAAGGVGEDRLGSAPARAAPHLCDRAVAPPPSLYGAASRPAPQPAGRGAPPGWGEGSGIT